MLVPILKKVQESLYSHLKFHFFFFFNTKEYAVEKMVTNVYNKILLRNAIKSWHFIVL